MSRTPPEGAVAFATLLPPFMELILVRHGESVGNAEERLQGQSNYPLTARGHEQARRLGAAFRERNLRFQAVYASPLERAHDTAKALAAALELPALELMPDLVEIGFGRLEGMQRQEIERVAPEFLTRGIEHLADYGAFGGESYEQVQSRVGRVSEQWFARHRGTDHRILIVGHGGMNFQIAKRLLCSPVPRVCLLKIGNCTSSLIRMAERRGTYLGELVWHVPLELWAHTTSEGASHLFR